METRVRLSKKFLATLPCEVANEVKQLSELYNVKTINVKTEVEVVYSGEGHTYAGFSGDMASSFEVASESNFGGSSLSYQIGKPIKMPSLSYLVEKYYFMGQNSITVYQYK